MHTISLSDFRANASGMLDKVAKGETVRIMRHGKPVADLVPVADESLDVTPSYQQPFTPVMALPKGYSAVQALLDERGNAPW